MSEKLIFPPDYVDVQEVPVVFLAGPIQGAPEWQAEATQILQKLAPEIYIASPRKKYLDGQFVYAEQVDWETHYLNIAAKNGVVMFWLAKEETHYPERAYAQTSRFELGEWKVKHERDGVKLVVGIEKGFSNERYIRRRLAQDCPQVVMPDTLIATCEQVYKLLKS
ncbi:MAG TPA: hypothetical protein DCS93_43690 [Microscillaceae bacterium]|nr:hypothetical protein [Microscillaceae bacterium]